MMVSQDEDTSATATAAGQSFSGATARRAAADRKKSRPGMRQG